MLEYLELLKEIFIVDSRYKYILEGLIFSISTTALAAIIGIVLGTVVALMQLTNFYPFRNIQALAKF